MSRGRDVGTEFGLTIFGVVISGVCCELCDVLREVRKHVSCVC